METIGKRKRESLESLDGTLCYSMKKEIDSFIQKMRDDMTSQLEFEKFKFQKEVELKEQERQDRVTERKDRLEMLRLEHAIVQTKLQLDKRSHEF
ncbi:hypothetical protein LEN26_004040 [Aphanomyces euteiches]|nr:hypothetical protein AeMF1_012162 [Aphanomyces euteiches]KAH9150667.1 hypothetical protein LEN26_004040 [Aphanomyces euteiches]KAH9181807.1 hypothetical protein AeNC1_016218 [Aphanomyces euteiches]